MLYYIKNVIMYVFNNKEYLLSLKKKIVEVEVVEERVELTKSEMVSRLDMSKYGTPIFVNDYNKDRPTIIMVDDLLPTKVLYDVAIKNIKHVKFNKDKNECEVDYTHDNKIKVLEDYNVLYFIGKNVGFSFLHFLESSNIKIDYIVLDITINTFAKVDDNILEIDGVDLAIYIDKKYPDCKIMFNTAHTMNPRNPTVSSYMSKFKQHFNVGIEKYSINKLSNLSIAIYSLIGRNNNG